jgi:hypothetical protein
MASVPSVERGACKYTLSPFRPYLKNMTIYETRAVRHLLLAAKLFF